jgi:hypothetical protein
MKAINVSRVSTEEQKENRTNGEKNEISHNRKQRA